MKVDVSDCIIDLLHRGESVSLPGIGAFSTRHSSSRIVGSQIFPPSRHVEFTDTENEHDKLAPYIQKKYKVTYKTAQNVVKKYCQILIRKMVNFNSVKIPNLGLFQKSDKGKFDFVEETNIVNLANSILPSFTLEKISIPEKPIPVVKAVTETVGSTLAAASSVVAAQTSVKSSSSSSSNQNIYTSSSTKEEEKSWFKNYFWPLFWLALLALILLFGFKKCSSYLSNQNGDVQEFVDGDDNDIDSDTSDSEVEYVQYSLDDIESIPEEVYADGCIIIVGAFGNSRNAVKMESRLRSMGYDTYKEVNDGGLTRVGLIEKCEPDNFESIIQSVRLRVEPTSWYLIPLLEVEY